MSRVEVVMIDIRVLLTDDSTNVELLTATCVFQYDRSARRIGNGADVHLSEHCRITASHRAAPGAAKYSDSHPNDRYFFCQLRCQQSYTPNWQSMVLVESGRLCTICRKFILCCKRMPSHSFPYISESSTTMNVIST